MSEVRDPETDQVAPVTVAGAPYIQDLVIADIEDRKQHGIRKYGTALQAGNGRNMLLDAYEEAQDLTIYLRGMLEEQAEGVCFQKLINLITQNGTGALTIVFDEAGDWAVVFSMGDRVARGYADTATGAMEKIVAEVIGDEDDH